MSSKKGAYRITNWPEYNKFLKQRGSLTIWLSEDFEKSWLAVKEEKQSRGRPFFYSDASMTLMLTLRQLFKLALRQLTGFVESLLTLIGKSLPVPEFSRLSKRMSASLSHLRLPPLKEASHIVIDSTGLKVFGEKEWLETKHGKQYQRKIWRKLHIGVDKQGYIIAREMTGHRTDDRACVNPLLAQVDTSFIDEVLADAGYDSHKVYKDLQNLQIVPLIPPPKNAGMPSHTPSSHRDKTIAAIKEKGYWAWYYKNDFGRRNKIENTFYRIKTIFGRKLLSRRWDNQDIETKLICILLNKMTTLGMPKTIKIS